jgi:cytochrome c oxidase subunit IV
MTMSHPSSSLVRPTIVFLALLILTGLTIGLSFLPLGTWHTPIGLAIAFTKGTLVALFFMDLIDGDRAHALALVAGLFWLALLVGLTLMDFLTRRWLAF